MLRRRLTRPLAVAVTASVAVACGTAQDPTVAGGGDELAAAVTTTTTAPPAPTAPPTPAEDGHDPAAGATAPAAATGASPTAPAVPPRARTVHEQDWTPFAASGPVVLRHPSRRVELVGFHQSNHEGAQQLDALPTAAAPFTMESRERATGDRSSADVVVDPEVEIRSPVTGTVKRAGSYILYCDTSDDFVVIDPDERPGWEVKILHISGVRVRPGDRVVAGETVLAPRPTMLPFESQIDESTAEPSWPHVHIEVVDPSIPNRPNGGSGYDDC